MIYEYECNKCRDYKVISMTVERMEHDKGLKRPCKCGGEYKRKLSATPIVVKGRGTYTISNPAKK